MKTNVSATQDRPRTESTGRPYLMGGEQYRRDMRAASHKLRQRLGKGLNGVSGGGVAVTAGPTPSTECRMRRKLFQKRTGFYTLFTFCGL